MSLRKLLIEGISEVWSNMSEEIINFLDREGYVYRYLTEGTEGYILELTDKNKLLKFVYRRPSRKLYEKVVGKNIPNVMKVFMYRELEGGYLVVMERLEPLTEEDPIIELVMYHLLSAESTSLLEEREEIINKVESSEYDPKILTVYDQLANGVRELMKLGIKYKDRYWKNIAVDPKTGEYKIIDLDSSNLE